MKGFDKVVWTAAPTNTFYGPGLELTYLSKDGEEGYPGNLKVKAIYAVSEKNELVVQFTATTDKDTVVNLTHHSYFNLRGSGNVLDSVVYINADKFTPVDSSLIPTGELKPVDGTPFDFRTPTPIGARINETNDDQIQFGHGYDHNWVIKKGEGMNLAASVYEPVTGRVMEVFTTSPGVQFYTGNFLGGITGKYGWAYQPNGAFCFEPQHFPDSPNHPGFPTTELKPVALALALVAFGCGKSETTPPAAGGQPAVPTAKKLKIAFVVNNSANFWTIARTGTEDASKELGNVDVDFRIPGSGTAAEQRQIMDDLLAKGEDGIAVSQTLLTCFDSDAPDSKRVCYIGTDNFAAGVEAGKLIKEALPNGGKIMAFVGFADAQNAKDRFGGIKKELEGSNIQIIDLRTDDADSARAQKNAEDTLVKYPDIAGLVGLYSYNGPAILHAVTTGGKAGQVKIVCFDEDAETLAGVASGQIYGTVVQQPYEFGKQTITRMDKYLGGDKSALAGGKIIIPTLSLKKDTVGAFSDKLKALLGK